MKQKLIRRCFALLLCAVLTLCTLPLCLASDMPSGAGYVSTAGGRLNVRSGPGTNYTVLTSVSNGAYLTVYGSENGFYKVGYAENKTGYVSRSYFTRITSAYTASVNITSGYLNVRSGAGTKYSVISALYMNDTVIVLSEENGWARVLYKNIRTGYVSSAYLKAQNEEKSVILSVPDLKQTDARWAGVTIGESGKTIAQIGCTTTCIAMCESLRLGYTVYPDEMAKNLTYSSTGSLYWPSNYVTSVSVSELLPTVKNLINNNKPVILGFTSPEKGTHWVTVIGYKNGGESYSDFYINDPGSSYRTLLSQFTEIYTGFYKMAYYKSY